MSDLPSVYTESFPKARKEHTCCECRRTIKNGDTYQLFKGCWDGEFSDYKTCMPCDNLRYEVKDPTFNEWPPFGCLEEWAHECELEFPPVE